MANAPEGTVVEMADGSRQIKRGGQWVSAGSLYVGSAPKLDPTDRKQLDTARASAQKAGGTIQDLDRFQALNERQPSGELLGLPIVRDVVGMFDPEVGEMNAISNRLTPAQRDAGSGAMSDRDVEMYRSSVVGMGKPGPTNQRVGAIARAGAIRQKEYAAFLDYFGRINGTLNGAQEMWDQYKTAEPAYDPDRGTVRRAKPWREFFGVSGGQQSASNNPARADLISQARDAISKGAPRAAVIQRLREQGVAPDGL